MLWGHVSATCTSAYQANKTAASHWITKPLSIAYNHVKGLRGAAGEFYVPHSFKLAVSEAIVATVDKKRPFRG